MIGHALMASWAENANNHNFDGNSVEYIFVQALQLQYGIRNGSNGANY